MWRRRTRHRQLAPWVLRRLLKADWADCACLNVNFPEVPAERAGPLNITRQGQELMKTVEVRRSKSAVNL
jgi:5'-nucleotidase